MTEIQEQVEQFIIDWLPDRQECPDEEDYFEHLGRYRKEAKAEMIEILRAFLEECYDHFTLKNKLDYECVFCHSRWWDGDEIEHFDNCWILLSQQKFAWLE